MSFNCWFKESFLRSCLSIFIALNAHEAEAQKIQELPNVKIEHLNEVQTIQKINKTQIKALQPDDVGQLLQKFAGISLKNYGGLGGLKTISLRGISGNHSGLVIDGFCIQNNQVGQIDFSNIQVENIENISLVLGGIESYLLPVSSFIGGSTISIQTFENQWNSSPFQIRSALKVGSFGQFDSYASLKSNRNKMFWSVSGKYRQAQGNYPFEIRNGNQNYKAVRTNNDLQEGFFTFSSGFKFNSKNTLRLNYNANKSNKGLPGAVILYNPFSVQRLNNESHQFNIDLKTISSSKSIFRNYLSVRYEGLNYVDSSFLNLQGFLKQDFFNTTLQQGISFSSQLKHKSIFFGGIEQNFSKLSSSSDDFPNPERYHLKSILGFDYQKNKFHVLLQMGGQKIIDDTKQHKVENKSALTPFVLVESNIQNKIVGKPKIWAKRTFRMPTFNELYYNQIGNTSLKPEIANQFNLGSNYRVLKNKYELKFSVDFYYNLVENKIIAIPTKNLFIWSIQNVGNVEIYGTDLQLSQECNLSLKTKISSQINYSYQRAIDVSNKTSSTYKHQLPYLPKHTLNSDVSFLHRKVGAHFSVLYTSSRYALNQNILANEIESFLIFDCSIFKNFELKNNQTLKSTLSIKNLSNQSYAFVRYFVMPGIHFLFSINYELN
jgi:vitamin B12 transporter